MRGRTASLNYIVGFAISAVSVATCSDLIAPAGLKGDVTIAYSGPPEAIGGAIQVTVGEKLSPTFQVSLSGIRQTRVRYVLSLAKPEDANVLRIFGRESDSVEAVGRGSATLVATLVVATVGPDAAHRASVDVIASPPSVGNPLPPDAAPPTINGITPADAVQGQTNVAVTVTGTNFVTWTTVDFGASVTVSNVAVVNETTLTATLAIAAGATTGLRDVIVTNATAGGGATLTNGFTVSAPAAPTMSLLSPASGERKERLTVAISGSNFYSGVTTFDFGRRIRVNGVSVISSTEASVSISIGQPADEGPRSVTVTNTPTGGSHTQQLAFTVLP